MFSLQSDASVLSLSSGVAHSVTHAWNAATAAMVDTLAEVCALVNQVDTAAEHLWSG